MAPYPGKTPPPTQDHLILRGFIEDVAVLDDGSLTRVLEAGPVDLGALGPDQQEWTLAQYEVFLRTLRFPESIQIVCATSPQEITPLLARLAGLRRRWQNEAGESRFAARAAERLTAQMRFLEEATRLARPMVDRYFVALSHNPFPLRTEQRVMTQGRFEEGIQILDRRTRRVVEGLERVGLAVKALGPVEIAAVVHHFYHRITAPPGEAAWRTRLRPSLVGGLEGESDEE